MRIVTVAARACWSGLFLFAFALTIFSTSCLFAQGSWSARSNVGLTPRGDYALAAAPDLGTAGKIYTFGGRMFTGTANILYNMIEVYDISTDTWSTVQYTGSMANRMWHSASYVNGKFYIVGGFHTTFGQTTSLIEEFDPVALTVKEVIPTGTVQPIYGVTGTTTAGGKIFSFGGFNFANPGGNNVVVSVFDPVANTWETKTPSGDALVGFRTNLAASTLGDDIYITGGLGGEDGYETFNANQKYSTVTGALTTLDPLISPLHSHSAVAVGGKLYFVGGQINISGTASPTPFVFDPHKELDKYQYLTVTGEHETNVSGTSVAVGNTIYQIGVGMRLDTITTQALTLQAASVQPQVQSDGLEITIYGRQLSARSSQTIDAIEMFDVTGRSVVENETRATSASINVRFLPSGFYLVKVLTSDGIKTAKVVLD